MKVGEGGFGAVYKVIFTRLIKYVDYSLVFI